MFLNDNNISANFLKEGLSVNGQRENILVVKMIGTPADIKRKNIKEYEALSEKLGYLDNLARNGFLEFNRIEVTSDDTMH